MFRLWAVTKRWWYMIGPAFLGIGSAGLDIAGLSIFGYSVRWDVVTLGAFIVFVSVVGGKLYLLDKAQLNERNRDECLKVLDQAAATVTIARERVEATLIWDAQTKIARDTWLALRVHTSKLAELGRPTVAYKVAYEFYLPPLRSDQPIDPMFRWFDRLEHALKTARKDVWKGRQ